MHRTPLTRSAFPAAALLAAFALLAGCAGNPVGPGGVTSVNAPPAPNVGDRWAYDVSSGYTRTSKGVLRQRVVEVTASGIVIESSGFQDGRATITPDLQWLNHPLGDDSVNAFSPAYPALVFPLAAGQRWDMKVEGRVIQPQTLGGAATGTNRVTIQGKVLGWERVKVPAGEFDTLRIRRLTWGGNFDDRSFGQSEIAEELWYAPSIGRVVRSESRWQRWVNYAVPRGHGGQYMLGDLTIMELLPPGEPRAALTP